MVPSPCPRFLLITFSFYAHCRLSGTTRDFDSNSAVCCFHTVRIMCGHVCACQCLYWAVSRTMAQWPGERSRICPFMATPYPFYQPLVLLLYGPRWQPHRFAPGGLPF